MVRYKSIIIIIIEDISEQILTNTEALTPQLSFHSLNCFPALTDLFLFSWEMVFLDVCQLASCNNDVKRMASG